MIGGMVASPTPTVPISGDSITLIEVPVPGRARARMLAAIQPAVPPPTIAMRLMCRVSVIPPLRKASCATLELALHAQEEAAPAVIIRERLVRPLQVRVLHRIGEVLYREEYPDMLVEVISHLPVELTVRRLENLADQLTVGAALSGMGKVAPTSESLTALSRQE